MNNPTTMKEKNVDGKEADKKTSAGVKRVLWMQDRAQVWRKLVRCTAASHKTPRTKKPERKTKPPVDPLFRQDLGTRPRDTTQSAPRGHSSTHNTPKHAKRKEETDIAWGPHTNVTEAPFGRKAPEYRWCSLRDPPPTPRAGGGCNTFCHRPETPPS